MELAQAFGIILKKHRKRAELSQEKLAEVCDIERTFVSMLERGERRPSLSMTFDLAKALDVTPNELVEEVYLLIQETTV